MRGITGRLVISVVAVLFVTLTALTAVVAIRSDQVGRAQVDQYTQALAAQYAATVQDQLTSAVANTTDVANTLAALHATDDPSREAVSEVIRAALDSHPEYAGASTAWEPDAFDGQDAAFVGTPESDATGRLLPYWYRDGDALSVTYLVDYEDPAVATWYHGPKASLAPILTEPYVYPINGVDVLMTTAAAPILEDGKFLGVVTADIDLTALSESLGAITPYDEGYVSLLTDVATVVTHPDADQLGSTLAGDLAATALAVTADGEPFLDVVEDPVLGTSAVTAIAPIQVTDSQRWTLLVSAPQGVAMATSTELRTTTIALGVLALAVAAAAAWVVGSRLTRPITRLRDRMIDIADGDGDLTQRVDEDRTDELGALGAAFNRFVGRVAETVSAIGGQATSLNGASDELRGASAQLSGHANDTAARAEDVASTASDVNHEVATFAAATEEMGASISSIARSVSEASKIADEAVSASRSASDVISSLSGSSAAIGDVVRTITQIAEQTNLLALNATIEAARAGEAGKGFAVVAGEVKELAQETARATDDIERRIAALASDVELAGTSVAKIGTVVDRLDEIQTMIAGAVEEQDATTREMAAGVSRASLATGDIATTIRNVAMIAGQTTTSASETAGSAEAVAGAATELRVLVGRFKV